MEEAEIMRQIVLEPASGKYSSVHLQNTILTPVNLYLYRNYFDKTKFNELLQIYPDGKAYMWGCTNGTNGGNEKQWQKVKVGDLHLFTRKGGIAYAGFHVNKIKNSALAEALWGQDENGVTWENIFFLDNVFEINMDYDLFNDLLNYKPNYIIQGFRVIPNAKAQALVYYILTIYKLEYFSRRNDSSTKKSATVSSTQKSTSLSPIFIDKFHIVNKLNIPKSQEYELKNLIDEIVNYHETSKFNFSKHIPNTSPRVPITININISLAPKSSLTQSKIKEELGEIKQTIEKGNLNPTNPKKLIEETIRTTIFEHTNITSDDCSWGLSKKLRFLLPTLNFVDIEKRIRNIIRNIINTYGPDNKELIVKELTKKLTKEAENHLITEKQVREELRDRFGSRWFENTCITAFNDKKDISWMFDEYLGNFKKYAMLNKTLEKLINKIINLINLITEENKILGIFSPSKHIVLYYDRIQKISQNRNRNVVEILAQVAAHEMEHAWHYADVMTVSGNWDSNTSQKYKWVKESIAEYFHMETKDIGSKFSNYEEYHESMFPYDGGYSGCIILKNNQNIFKDYYLESLKNMPSAYDKYMARFV